MLVEIYIWLITLSYMMMQCVVMFLIVEILRLGNVTHERVSDLLLQAITAAMFARVLLHR